MGGKIRDQADKRYHVDPGDLEYNTLLVIEARKGDSYKTLIKAFERARRGEKGIGVLLTDPHNLLGEKGFDFRYMSNSSPQVI